MVVGVRSGSRVKPHDHTGVDEGGKLDQYTRGGGPSSGPGSPGGGPGAGSALPLGGVARQFLVKQSSSEGDATWANEVFGANGPDDGDTAQSYRIEGGTSNEGTGATGAHVFIEGGNGAPGESDGGRLDLVAGASLEGQAGASIFVRGGTDDGDTGGALRFFAGGGTKGGAILAAAGSGATGNPGGSFSLSSGEGDGGTDLPAVFKAYGGTGTGTHGYLELTTGSLTFEVHAGTDDPSAGAGVPAPLLSTYHRDNSGTGELWYKTGSGDTDWTMFGAGGGGGTSLTPASYTITNDSTDHAFNANATSIDELADVLATVIRELMAGSLTAGTYTITNDSTDRTYNANATSIDELADILATLIRDLGGA